MDEIKPPVTDAEESGAEGQCRTLRLADFVDLFTRPRVFFSGRLDLKDSRFLVPVAWAMGVAAQFDRIDAELVESEFDVGGGGADIFAQIASGPWIFYWGWALLLGLLTGGLMFYIGGWWFRMRLKFSGGTDLDVETPRHIFTYSDFVMTLPHLLVTVIYTLTYPNYMAAYNSAEMWSTFLLLFIFWSVAVSYAGATTAFRLHPWKARFWFLILPIGFYLVIMGGIVWLVTVFQ